MKPLKHYFISVLAVCLISYSCSDDVIKYEEGFYQGELLDSSPHGYGTWIGKDMSYVGFWENGQRNGQGVLIQGKYKYRGGFKKGDYDGVGTLTIGDSIVYSGCWKDGKRNGEGIIKDKYNNTIRGLWKRDSLITAMCLEGNGIYEGNLDQNLMPSGLGKLTYGDMLYYEGEWKEGKPDGFGFEMSPDGFLRIGIWKNGIFKGEIITFTSERIYGIDIARYQHKAPINWDALRIIYLGNLSKKKIKGRVNYPISFIFIKCTEGETVKNPYYEEDYIQARKRDIACGSYHFFSIHSTPENQAANFINNLKYSKGDFAPILDLEPTESEIEAIGGSRELMKRVRIWLNLVEKHTHVKPILYINQMFVTKHMPYAPDLLKTHDVWIARYGEYKPFLRSIIWQFAPDGAVRGIKGDVDINVFNGYRPAYNRYLRNKTCKQIPPDDNI